MRLKKTICILMAAALLLVSLTPLAARNTPYPNIPDDPIAHPWQDDNQTEPDDPQTRVTINFGGILVGFDLPSFLVPTGLKPKPATTIESNRSEYRAVSKRGYRGIKNVVTTKGY